VILVSEKGDNSIVVTPGANAKVTPQDLEKEINLIRAAGIVLTQLEIPIETVEYLALLCGREGIPLILDPAPAVELPDRMLKHVEWFTPNQSEAAFYRGEDASARTGSLASPARAGLSQHSQSRRWTRPRPAMRSTADLRLA
jgi:ribokinase